MKSQIEKQNKTFSEEAGAVCFDPSLLSLTAVLDSSQWPRDVPLFILQDRVTSVSPVS